METAQARAQLLLTERLTELADLRSNEGRPFDTWRAKVRSDLKNIFPYGDYADRLDRIWHPRHTSNASRDTLAKDFEDQKNDSAGLLDGAIHEVTEHWRSQPPSARALAENRDGRTLILELRGQVSALSSLDEVEAWQLRADAALRHALGVDHKLIADLASCHFYPSFGWSGQTEADVREAFEHGKRQAEAILDTALLELDLTENEPAGGGSSGVARDSDPSKVFVVYGRDANARESLFGFLRSIGLHPLDWLEVKAATGKPMPTTLDVIRQGFSMARAAVVLFTPDDEACLREPLRSDDDPAYEAELTGQPRQNVLLEAGMAMGVFPYRTVLVELGSRRPFTDIEGLNTVRLTDTVAKRQELAMMLENATCRVNLAGTDWHTTGNFSIDRP